MANQVSVFMQNKPGRLRKLTEALKSADVNIRAITIASNEDFGVVKLIVDDPEKAYERLHAEGFSARMKSITAIIMKDEPGGLNAVCESLERNEINISDAYGFVVNDRESAVLVLEVEDVEKTEKLLHAEGFKLLSDEDLYSL